ncbi:MAG TPA: PhoX family phosphatase [Noviherbaspirillum sp.]|nr:PhoX family phosphatase [Noviherbaspirillum sp.]
MDADDTGFNDSGNPDFNSVLNARMSRRDMMRVSAVSAGTALLGSLGLSACGGSDAVTETEVGGSEETLLGFNAVAKSLADTLVVPAGYTATVLYALGDPLNASTPAFKNDGTDTSFDTRAGDHHDGIEYFPLSGAGTPSKTSSDRALLAMNHEATTDETRSSFFLHADGGTTTLPRPASEIDKEVDIHGVSVVEIRKTNNTWATVQNSAFNRRFTPLTEMDLSGPVRGNALVQTVFSTNGTLCRGTLNNCGTGKTPWGTLITGEENWGGYFTRGSGDNAARGNDKSVTALNRYGRAQGAASRHGWESGGEARHARWDISASGASAIADYRNELNTFGYIVEIDPYNATSRAKKRTALGRFAHENGAFGKLVAGQPLAVYMGDDSRGEYMYKFVSQVAWNPVDADPANRMATGDKYLDSGRLYVARFNADGSGEWIELNISNAQISGYANYTFTDQADVLVNARLAADAVGATRMDRPEWCNVHPTTGEIYYTLTNNSQRTTAAGNNQVNAANPRAYTDIKGTSQTQNGNVNGHIIRIREGAAGNAATAFTWDVYLFGAEAGADPTRINLSGLTSDQDFSSPDGLVFSESTGICWIQTDDGAYTDVTNCMMLAALPGQVGDGAPVTINYGGGVTVTTPVGAKPTQRTLKRFLVGPKGSEITGICESPDGRAIFVNIQHPGENTLQADIGDPGKYQSQWPANAGYGAGNRPRSATVVITRNDGGRVGT